MPPLVHIVILAWDGSHWTDRCLQSLEAQNYPNFQVIVVDNGSATPCTPGHSRRFATCVIRLARNQGFAGGVNAGIRAALAAGAAYVWLLNDDAETAPDTLSQLVAACEADPGIGLASPVIHGTGPGAKVWFHGGLISTPDLTFGITDRPEVYQAWVAAFPTRIWLYGTALLIRRVVVERIGLFDEAMFAYAEDDDYSLRSIQAGFRNVIVPTAHVAHEPGHPSGNDADRAPYYHYYTTRNQLLLLRKHGGLLRNARPTFWALLAQGAMARRLRGRPEALSALRQGVWDGMVGIVGAYRRRGSAVARLGQATLAAAGVLGRIRGGTTPQRGSIGVPDREVGS